VDIISFIFVHVHIIWAVKKVYFLTFRQLLFTSKKAVLRQSLTSLDDLTILLSPVRDGAAAAIFDAVFQHHKVASAGCAQCIERAIAKQAVELTLVYALMAREMLAGAILKEARARF
jgi:hypothetical protein